MKKQHISAILLSLFLFIPIIAAGTLEIEIITGVDHLTYGDFFNPYAITADLTVKSEISDNIGFSVQLSRDSILFNSLNACIMANTDFFNVEFGPFIAISDSLGNPVMGVTGGLGIMYPGIAFFNINGSSSLGVRYDFTGNDYRESAEAKLGFWLPYIIPSFSASIKSNKSNELSRIMLSADIFVKNFPLIFNLDAGYEKLKYNDSSLSAVFAGTGTKLQISHIFNLIAGFEMPVIITKRENMDNSVNPIKLFKAYAGLGLTLQ